MNKHQPGFTNGVACSGRYSDTCNSRGLGQSRRYISHGQDGYSPKFFQYPQNSDRRNRSTTVNAHVESRNLFLFLHYGSHLDLTRGSAQLPAASTHIMACHLEWSRYHIGTLTSKIQKLEYACFSIQISDITEALVSALGHSLDYTDSEVLDVYHNSEKMGFAAATETNKSRCSRNVKKQVQ